MASLTAIDIQYLTEIRSFMDRSPLVLPSPPPYISQTATNTHHIPSLTQSQAGEPSGVLTTVSRFPPRVLSLTQSQNGEPSGVLTTVACFPPRGEAVEEITWRNPFGPRALFAPVVPRAGEFEEEERSPRSSEFEFQYSLIAPNSPYAGSETFDGFDGEYHSGPEDTEEQALTRVLAHKSLDVRAPRPRSGFRLKNALERWSKLSPFYWVGEGGSSWDGEDLLGEYASDEAKPTHSLLARFAQLGREEAEELRRLDARISALEREVEAEEFEEVRALRFLAEVGEDVHPALRRHSVSDSISEVYPALWQHSLPDPISGSVFASIDKEVVIHNPDFFASLYGEIEDTAGMYVYAQIPQDEYPNPSTPKIELVERWLRGIAVRGDSPTLRNKVSPHPHPSSPYREVSRFSVSSQATSYNRELSISSRVDQVVVLVPEYHDFDIEAVEAFLASLSPRNTPAPSHLASKPFDVAAAEAFLASLSPHHTPASLALTPRPFSELEVEALLSSPGPDFSDHDILKDPTHSLFRLSPHPPSDECYCHHCDVYFESPLFGWSGVDRHDFSEWCWCYFCVLIRQKAEKEERLRAERLKIEREEAKREKEEERKEARRAKLLERLRSPSWLERADIPMAIDALLSSPNPVLPMPSQESTIFVRRAVGVVGGASMSEFLESPVTPERTIKRRSARLFDWLGSLKPRTPETPSTS